MRLSKRDRAILSDLNRFRCMSRNDVAVIHFSTVKDSVKAANNTLLRLYRQGLIDRSANFEPFVYFPASSIMKKASQKIPHFLEIVGVYRELLAHEPPATFSVEPKYSKGLAEPDIFTIFKNSPLFIEVQRSNYSEKIMAEKIARYEALYTTEILDQEPWQRGSQPPVFPAVLLLTTTRYSISSPNFPIMQASSVAEFMQKMAGSHAPATQDKPKRVPVITLNPAKVKFG